MIYNEIQLKVYFLIWVLYGMQKLQRYSSHHYLQANNQILVSEES